MTPSASTRSHMGSAGVALSPGVGGGGEGWRIGGHSLLGRSCSEPLLPL